MNYSTALLESIEAAQILAGHYQGHTLDTWHLLTAMANNPYSIAGSVLSDYPRSMSFRMQRSILQAKLFKATIGMKSSHFLIGWKPL